MFARRSIRRLVACLGIALGSTGMVACNHHGKNHGERADWVAKRVSGYLDFTATQNQKLDVVKTKVKDLFQALDSKRDAARSILREEVAKEKMDSARLNQSLQANLSVLSEKLPAIVDAVVELHSSLNPAQRSKVAEKVQKFEGRHKGK
ncbi:MAG: hypothetical protein EBR09_04910 [Proteobacteria bacterium]|nr:hypothetical protein [Pseudomonadota bacterium]